MSGFGASESLLGGFADPKLSNFANLCLLVLLQAFFEIFFLKLIAQSPNCL